MKVKVMGSVMRAINKTNNICNYEALVGELTTPEILINRNDNVIDMTK
jgi:hypothetical protein